MGGYIGFISYDFSAHQFINGQNHIQPSLFLGQYRSFLKYIDNDWYFLSDEESAIDLFSYIENKIENYTSSNSKNTFELKTTIQPRWSKKQYFDAFYKIQEYIKAGDCYQINLTQEFKAKFSGSLLNKAKDPNEKGFNLQDIIGSISGGKGGGLMDLVTQYGGALGLDQNGDGKVDMQDAITALSGKSKGKSGGLGGLLGGLFGKK